MDEAIAALASVAIDDPEAGIALHLRGVTQFTRGRFADAVDDLTAWAAASPDNAEALNDLGNALQASERFEKAEAAYRRALGLAPDFAPAHNNLGLTLLSMNGPEESIGCFETTLRLADPVQAHNNLGQRSAG